MSGRPWLVTGAAGFIGFHLCRRLIGMGRRVVALDSLEGADGHDVTSSRLEILRSMAGVTWHHVDVADEHEVAAVMAQTRAAVVVHLAARTGVRGSHLDPLAYVRANVTGFANVLQNAQQTHCEHFVYASSSSVYGVRSALPYQVQQPADHPISLYAATKRADELLAHSYAHTCGLRTTGLRFFTVYGPWGRPDMAYFAFADAILADEPVVLFGDGTARRDFTYIDDVVDAIVAIAERPPTAGRGCAEAGCEAPWRLLNVGRGSVVSINELVSGLEARLGRRARRIAHPDHPGDVTETLSDPGPLATVAGRSPSTAFTVGLDRFVDWLVDYRAHRPREGAGA